MSPGRALVLSLCIASALAGCAGEPPAGERARPAEQSGAPASGGGGGDVLARMQGRWQSDDDPQSVIEIQGDRLTSRYAGEALDSGRIVFTAACAAEGAAEGDPSGLFRVESGPDSLCYQLVSLTDSALTYSYLARGNTLAYHRVR